MEREKICANGYCEAECPYAIVRENHEPHQSMLGHYEGGLFKVTSVRNEEKVWEVFCKALEEEKFVGYVWPYFSCPAPKTCPLLVAESAQTKKKTFWSGIKEFFKK